MTSGSRGTSSSLAILYIGLDGSAIDCLQNVWGLTDLRLLRQLQELGHWACHWSAPTKGHQLSHSA
eukprot:CAMPEP_0174350608 /NCGR_PEP_ID=MMETSP0811_2-20130205/7720_1 /TAXON_ID=73025 ORGANISM="Eutreptiella gymnastica-like, Strain CCMP1594" /NCGR_SAMPLE_ID=MMETSP0811_2 /ASSEMBLY_ACC=CAM_ASM_000667 /LENGTH=65 /DNA_ID=CAMNT_0015479061 /DNA_START=2629 /DNA_END=2823 /DNA_ORIENTATION=+